MRTPSRERDETMMILPRVICQNGFSRRCPAVVAPGRASCALAVQVEGQSQEGCARDGLEYAYQSLSAIFAMRRPLPPACDAAAGFENYRLSRLATMITICFFFPRRRVTATMGRGLRLVATPIFIFRRL